MTRSRCFRRLAPALLAAALIAVPAAAEEARIRYVTDGDTFRLTSGERIRIAGIDAPETDPRQARCRQEVALGHAATATARDRIEGRVVAIERVGRSYNRTVARVRIDGRDLAGLLVEQGAARWWPRGIPKPDWCGSATPRR